MLWTPETLPAWRRYSDVFKPLAVPTTITGTDLATVWDPASGKKFVLKGFSITAVVVTVLNAAAPRALRFWDDSTSDPFLDLQMVFEKTAPEGVWYTTRVVELGDPRPSGAADRVLKAGFSGTIDTGVVSLAGAAWGVEL